MSRCAEIDLAVNQCHQQYGKSGEECVQEELGHKKCHAQVVCSREAAHFYNDRIGGSSSASCSTLLERFAFPENEMLLRQDMASSKEIKNHCRGVARDLARCMRHKYKGY